MQDKTEIILSDMKSVCDAEFIPWDKLRGTTVLITGSTGLIGLTIIKTLLYANRIRDLGVRVLALVRNEEKAMKLLSAELKSGDALNLLVGNVENIHQVDGAVDYVIHAASQTSSQTFVNQPVETIHTALRGTGNILEIARQKSVKGVVYLSSMEVYGYPRKGHKVTEGDAGAVAPTDVRNSYSLSKLQCEGLCCAYAAEYSIPAMIVRLTQTFGPGVQYEDQRVFAQFARCAIEKRDIVLRTKGETERSYLYTADAATAILTVLLKGQPGTAYNAADESTYCSIEQMAHQIAREYGIEVRFELQNTGSPYLNTLYMDLDVSRLKALGWSILSKKENRLMEAYRNMIGTMEND